MPLHRMRSTGDLKAAILAAAGRGILRREIEETRPRVHVQPFEAARKRVSIERSDGVLYVKGAGEVALRGEVGALAGAAAANVELAARGLRVLAVAVGRGSEEAHLDLLGLIGIADPPRPEAIEAVAAARAAGIKTVMITGDHPATAHAIARELGILAGGDAPNEVVRARATPEDKLAIVRAWKARGAVVAMTGDGVNDAPALREAHIGIAMGRTGTEVTREASDMILANDNFASIIKAVREGRGIFENIRKTLVYLLAGNTGELAVMWPRRAGLAAALLPLHLLDQPRHRRAAGARARGRPVDDDVLSRPPRSPDEPVRTARVDLHRPDRSAGGDGDARCLRLGAAVTQSWRGAQPGVFGARLLRAVPRVRRPEHHTHFLEGGRLHQPAAARGRDRVRPAPALDSLLQGHRGVLPDRRAVAVRVPPDARHRSLSRDRHRADEAREGSGAPDLELIRLFRGAPFGSSGCPNVLSGIPAWRRKVVTNSRRADNRDADMRLK